MSNYLPGIYTLPAAVKGDTYPGIPNLTIRVNGAAPTNALASVKMQFRTEATSETLALELTSADGEITINDADDWDVTVEPIAAATTAGLDAAVYVYDIEFTDDTGNVRTYVTGTWNLAQDVTRTA